MSGVTEHAPSHAITHTRADDWQELQASDAHQLTEKS